MNKRLFFRNAAMLVGSSALLRLSNIWFRVFISAKIGASGMGLYQLIFCVFSLGITISVSGSGLIVTRLVAEGQGTRASIGRCLLFSLGISLSAAAVLFFAATPIAVQFLNDANAAPALRILAPGLPFIAVCACLKGYFLAVRNSAVPACGEIMEQIVTIGASVAFFYLIPQNPLFALMLGSTAGEIISCAFVSICYFLAVRKRGLHGKTPSHMFRRIFHIAIPVVTSSSARSLLSSGENLLIPRGLKQYGATENGALAQYGMMQGMVMPILYFPSSVLSPLSTLLIPEMAEANAEGRRRQIQHFAQRAFQITLFFSFLVATVLIVFADDLGMAFYGNEELGSMLRIMAPIVPLSYLDTVVDGMLKGLDQQMYSLKYNFTDSIMRVVMIAVLVPFFGLKAYFFILFFSEIYNATLSINRLLTVTELEVDIVGWIITPAVCAALLYYVLLLFRSF